MGYMNQFVNAALAALKQGDKNKAMEYLKQAIAANQKDVDAWLVLSTLMDPERKRQCLNRVLTLEPTNKIAREEMLKLDRAAMGNMPIAQPSRPIQGKNIQTPPPPPEKPAQSYYSQQPSTPQTSRAQAPSPQPVAPQRKVDKPLVFRYPILILLATYFFAGLFFLFNIIAVIYPTMLLVACGLSLASLASIWVVSSKVEVSEEGISSSSMFGLIRSQVKWDEIARVNSAAMGNKLALVTKKGSSVKINSQVSGYPTIVKILREKRPDLFNIVSPGYAENVRDGYIPTQQATGFTGKRVFKKGMFRRFGSYIVIAPFLLVMIRALFTDQEHIFEASLATMFFLLMMLPPFFEVFEVTVMGNKITVVSMVDEKEFDARQIREVTIKSVRRKGAVFHFPVLVTEKGKKYSLQGFSEGTEILYGFLLNWWNTYRYQ
jgi:hypothetical protein